MFGIFEYENMYLGMFEYETMYHLWGGIMTFPLKVSSTQWAKLIMAIWYCWFLWSLCAFPLLACNACWPFAAKLCNIRFQLLSNDQTHFNWDMLPKCFHTNQSIIHRPNARLWAQVPRRTLCLPNQTHALGSVCNLYLLASAHWKGRLLDHNKHAPNSKLTIQCF